MDKDYFQFFCDVLMIGVNVCLLAGMAVIIGGLYKSLKEKNASND